MAALLLSRLAAVSAKVTGRVVIAHRVRIGFQKIKPNILFFISKMPGLVSFLSMCAIVNVQGSRN